MRVDEEARHTVTLKAVSNAIGISLITYQCVPMIPKNIRKM